MHLYDDRTTNKAAADIKSKIQLTRIDEKRKFVKGNA